MSFKATYIKSLKPRSARYEKWDGNGLGIRVSPNGTKSWVLVYHFEGRPRRMTLGRFPSMSVKKAGEAAAKARADVERGIDPGAEAVSKRRQERQAETVRELVDLYLEKWAKPRKRSWREDYRGLHKYVLPRWGRRKAASIKRRDVQALLDDLIDEGLGVGANRVYAIVRKMFNFAVEREIVEVSPCSGIRPPAPERQRDRVLELTELQSFFKALPKAKMSPLTRLVFQFQLLTACRIGEAVGAAWDEVDWQGEVWNIPAERSKNSRAHRVPLSPSAIRVLKEIQLLTPAGPWIFPSPNTGRPMTGSAMARALANNRKRWENAGIPHFTPHDLRRSAASHMTSLGIPRLVVSKILNHVESGVTAVYDRHSYDREKREALDLWARHVEGLLRGKAGKASSA